MRAVNLLTPDQRSAPKGKGSSGPSALDAPGGIGAFVLLGALALCVAGLAGYVLSNNVVKDRKAELAQVSAESAATVEQAGKLKPYADFQTLAQARAGTVQALAAARFDWEQALRDLSRAMPKEVYLSSLDGTVGGGGAPAPRLRGPSVARHRAQGLHQEPAGGRRPDVADAQRPGRDPRDAREVRQGHRARRRPGHRHGQPLRQGRPAVLRDRHLLRALGSRRSALRRHRRRRPRRAGAGRGGDPAAGRAQAPATARLPPRRPPRRLPEVPSEPSQHHAARGRRRGRGDRRLLDARPAPEARAGDQALALDHGQAGATSRPPRPSSLPTSRRSRATRPTTRSSPGSARPSRPTTTSARCWSRSTRPPARARSTSARSRRRRRRPGGGRQEKGARSLPRRPVRRPSAPPASRRCRSRSPSRAPTSASVSSSAPGPLRRGQAAAPGRHRPPDGARQDLAAPRHDGLPEHARPDQRHHVPAAGHRGPHGRRHRGGSRHAATGTTPAAPAPATPAASRPTRPPPLEPPHDRLQGHLALPGAAQAVAGRAPPRRRGRRRADAALQGPGRPGRSSGRRRQVRRVDPHHRADRRARGRRRPCRAPACPRLGEGPFKPNATPTPTPTPAPVAPAAPADTTSPRRHPRHDARLDPGRHTPVPGSPLRSRRSPRGKYELFELTVRFGALRSGSPRARTSSACRRCRPATSRC